jgi:general secretion pathway protein E/type IV pilus assembly protein PilB
MNALMTCGVPEERLQEVLAQEVSVSVLASLDSFTVRRIFSLRFPARVLLEKAVAPLREENGIVHAVIADPFDLEGIDQLRLMTGIDFEIGLAGRSEISRFVKKHLGLGADTIQSMVDEAREQGLEYMVQADMEDVDLMEAAKALPLFVSSTKSSPKLLK